MHTDENHVQRDVSDTILYGTMKEYMVAMDVVHRCVLTEDERQALYAWTPPDRPDDSERHTYNWPGWRKHIGLPPTGER